MLRLAGAALLMAVSTPAVASDWYFVVAAPDNANISFVDKDSIHTEDDGSTHAMMFALLAETDEGVSAYRFEIGINCDKRESRLVAGETYDAAHAPMGEEKLEDDWQPIEATSQGAPIADFICSNGKPSKDSVAVGRELPFDAGKSMLAARSKAK